jgi:hypothetical protein
MSDRPKLLYVTMIDSPKPGFILVCADDPKKGVSFDIRYNDAIRIYGDNVEGWEKAFMSITLSEIQKKWSQEIWFTALETWAKKCIGNSSILTSSSYAISGHTYRTLYHHKHGWAGYTPKTQPSSNVCTCSHKVVMAFGCPSHHGQPCPNRQKIY